jgi:NADH:ubiquinone oxidoreductase subunit
MRRLRDRTSLGLRGFVLFKGAVEASKVPADWHGWLHHTQDDTPPEGRLSKA